MARSSILVIAVPRDAFGARLNDTVTAGNCPWCVMASASVVSVMCVKALRGIARAPTEATEVFGVVPAEIPCDADDPDDEVAPARTVAGLFSTFAEGVYLTEVVRAFEPADAEADDEKLVEAPAPVAPEDALDWMKRDPRLPGFRCHSGAVSRITWYWLVCV